MASQEQVSTIFKSLGTKLADAHNAAKDVPVNTGGGGLPEGIRGGVALLSEMSFIEGKKEEDKGKYYFSAVGVVVHPQYHDGIKCAGKQTRTLIPFFDTPKRTKTSFEKDHYPKFRDLFEKLGVTQPPAQQPGESKDALNERVMNYYMSAIAVLTQQKTPFNFRTWKGEKTTEGEYAGKEPNVQEVWETKCEWKPDGAAANPAAGIAAPPSAPPVEPRNSAPPSSSASSQAPTTVVPVATAPIEPATTTYTTEQLTDMAETADADTDGITDEAKDATVKISAAAKAVGITDEEAGPLTWLGLVQLIVSKSAATEPTPTVAPVEPSNGVVKADPVKGDFRKYDGKLCEVTSVNADTRLVTLKGPDGKHVTDAQKKLLKIPFDQLS